jgi:hypothetical protein
MPTTLTNEEIVERGREIYDRDIRSRVESAYQGRFLVVDVLSGDFEIADSDRLASDQLRAKNPNCVLYGIRIGYPTAYRIGSSSTLRPV